MHEWSLADAIVSYVFDKLKCSQVNRLVIGLGELQNIDVEVLRSAIESISRLRGKEIKEIVFNTVLVVFKCNRCGHTWSLSDVKLSSEEREAIHFIPEAVYAYVSCPQCGSRDYEILEGRGVEIIELRGENCNV